MDRYAMMSTPREQRQEAVKLARSNLSGLEVLVDKLKVAWDRVTGREAEADAKLVEALHQQTVSSAGLIDAQRAMIEEFRARGAYCEVCWTQLKSRAPNAKEESAYIRQLAGSWLEVKVALNDVRPGWKVHSRDLGESAARVIRGMADRLEGYDELAELIPDDIPADIGVAMVVLDKMAGMRNRPEKTTQQPSADDVGS